MQWDTFVSSKGRSSGPQLPLKVAHLPGAGRAVGRGGSEGISFVGRSCVVSASFQGQGSLRAGASLRRGCHWATVIPTSAGHPEPGVPRSARALVRGGAEAAGEGEAAGGGTHLPAHLRFLLRQEWSWGTPGRNQRATLTGGFSSSSPQAFRLGDSPLAPDALSQQLLGLPTSPHCS